MKLFVSPTPPPPVKSRSVTVVSLIYVGILTVMAVAQLFTFEDFAGQFVTFDLPGGRGFAYFVAPFLVAAEVFALPYLLRMAVSPAFRWLSIGLGWIAALLWLFLSCWALAFTPEVATVGFLGAVVDVEPGVFSVVFSFVLLGLATWASWGMARSRTR